MKYKAYDQFEYMILNVNGYKFDYIINKLNILGKEGWEYIFEKENKYVLKRKIIEYDIC